MYYLAAKLATLAENGKGYKSTLFSKKHPQNIRSTYFLVANAVKKKDIIDELLSMVGLYEEVKSQKWLSRVLVTEILWGHGKLPKSKPLFRRIADYRAKLQDALLKIDEKYPQDDEEIPRYIRINSEEFTKEMAVTFLTNKGYSEIQCPTTYNDFLSTLKSLKEEEFVFDFHVPYLIAFNKKTKIDILPSVSFIRQDKASCLVSLLLSPLPGSCILDLCAAPGLKTQHASSLIHKMGKIYSVDINRGRFKTLQNTWKDFKLESCVQLLNMDALKTTESFCPGVQYIIIDPPCSGTGMVNLLMRHTADETRLKKLSNLQAMILKHGLRQFNSARRLVYSTCSVKEEENEGVIRECLPTAEELGWRLVPLKETFKGSFSTGKGSLGESVLRLETLRDLTNGFFLALFERSVPIGSTKKEASSILDGDTFSFNVVSDDENVNEHSPQPKGVTQNSKNKKLKQFSNKHSDKKTVKTKNRLITGHKGPNNKSKRRKNS